MSVHSARVVRRTHTHTHTQTMSKLLHPPLTLGVINSRLTMPNWLQADKVHKLAMALLCLKLEGNCPLLHLASRVSNMDCYASDMWPWPFTDDLDLQFHGSQGQGWPSCKKIKVLGQTFMCESGNGQTDGRYLVHYLSDSVVHMSFYLPHIVSWVQTQSRPHWVQRWSSRKPPSQVQSVSSESHPPMLCPALPSNHHN